MTLLSFENFLELPNLDAGKRELIEGELFEFPPTTAPHNTVADCVVSALNLCLETQGRCRNQARMEAGFEIHTPRSSWLQPDVSVLHPRQRISAAGYYQAAPMIAIEVISPLKHAGYIDRKRLIYLANGSEEVWTVHLASRQVATAHSHGGQSHEDAITSPLLPDFCLPFDELFQAP